MGLVAGESEEESRKLSVLRPFSLFEHRFSENSAWTCQPQVRFGKTPAMIRRLSAGLWLGWES
jgi:hypothetical protein